MNALSNPPNVWLSLISATLLIMGIKMGIRYLVVALWLSLTILLLHYRMAGGEILGAYFDYKNASIYTINLFVLIGTLLTLLFKHPLFKNNLYHYTTIFLSISLVAGSLLLLINLWINAQFIENRRPGSPIIQITPFTPLKYCNYRYVFYKVDLNNQINYMCPNYYKIIPSIGPLDISPEFLINQFKSHNNTKANNKER